MKYTKFMKKSVINEMESKNEEEGTQTSATQRRSPKLNLASDTLDASVSEKRPVESATANNAETHGHSSVVAQHYNMLPEAGLEERSKSRIFYLRNFNNWVKSMLISEYLVKIDTGFHGSPFRVLDMCCGKGGDLFKWKRGGVTHLVCADIAATSMEQCQARYNELLSRSQRNYPPVFSAEFITADCSRVRLREQVKDPSLKLDLVSCQFSFHYCFESLPQAEMMLRNASECLKPGGFFIGTMPDAYEIVSRLQKNGGNSFGNDLYKVCFEGGLKEPVPLFGAKYNFHLEGVVDCPEFLVHFPTLTRLAEDFGLKLVMRDRFHEFYERQKAEGRSLLGKMQGLETYPPFHEAPLLSKVEDDYEHAEKYMLRSTGHRRIGTLSNSEWEAASLYLVFAFEKVGTKTNAEGKLVYDVPSTKKRKLQTSEEPREKRPRIDGESSGSS